MAAVAVVVGQLIKIAKAFNSETNSKNKTFNGSRILNSRKIISSS